MAMRNPLIALLLGSNGAYHADTVGILRADRLEPADLGIEGSEEVSSEEWRRVRRRRRRR
jgi:hypothetical protein